MSLLKKIFCLHKWTIHTKVKKTERNKFLSGLTIERDFTRDILICEKCGKIKIIEY